jgi:hypothetical protein
MGIKQEAIKEFEAMVKEFDIPASRLGRELFNDPSFLGRLRLKKTRVTDVTLDKIFKHAVTLRKRRETHPSSETEKRETEK